MKDKVLGLYPTIQNPIIDFVSVQDGNRAWTEQSFDPYGLHADRWDEWEPCKVTVYN